MRKFSIVLLVFICHMGCVGYADDLDRFIEGQIGFEEIQSSELRQEIALALQNKLRDSQEEHDLYEKLCYAAVLHYVKFYDGWVLYEIYLSAKNACSPHKLDWDRLLEKIKMESGMDALDILHGADLYEECQRNGGHHSDLLDLLPSYNNYYQD